MKRETNDHVSSSVVPTPQGKGFASDETRFPAYETRLKQSACMVVPGSALRRVSLGIPPNPCLGLDLLRTHPALEKGRCPAAFFCLQTAHTSASFADLSV